MTSYLSENEAAKPQNGDVHLAQIPDFEMEYLENVFGALLSVMARFFCIFHSLSFELNSFFDRSFPLKVVFLYDFPSYANLCNSAVSKLSILCLPLIK